MPTCTLKKKCIHSRFPDFKILGKLMKAESIRSLFSLSLVLLSGELAISSGCLSAIHTLPSPQPSAVITSQATPFSSARRLLGNSHQALPPGPSYPLPITQSFQLTVPWKILHFACEVQLPALSLQRAVATNTLSCLECLLYWGKRLESRFPGTAFLPLWGLSWGLFPVCGVYNPCNASFYNKDSRQNCVVNAWAFKWVWWKYLLRVLTIIM